MTQATLLVRHQVKDFDSWNSVYESLDGMRKEHGCIGAEVLVDPSDNHDIYVLHRFPSLAQAQAYAASSELHEAMGSAGVEGTPRIEIAVGT